MIAMKAKAMTMSGSAWKVNERLSLRYPRAANLMCWSLGGPINTIPKEDVLAHMVGDDWQWTLDESRYSCRSGEKIKRRCGDGVDEEGLMML
jgi:hypothetical protein